MDLVYIATPHSHHGEQIEQCVTHGKAVLCEKAFTATAAQAERALALAKEKGVLVTEAIWTRYVPMRRMLDELLASGAIGTPRVLTANLGYTIYDKERIRRPELAGGALLDVGVYVLNFAAMVFGTQVERMESSVHLMDTGVDMQEHHPALPGWRMAELMATAACNSRAAGSMGIRGFAEVDNVNNPRRITCMPMPTIPPPSPASSTRRRSSRAMNMKCLPACAPGDGAPWNARKCPMRKPCASCAGWTPCATAGICGIPFE